jgi:hypothetical protein
MFAHKCGIIVVEISFPKFTLSDMSNKEHTVHFDEYKKIFDIPIKYKCANKWVT